MDVDRTKHPSSHYLTFFSHSLPCCLFPSTHHRLLNRVPQVFLRGLVSAFTAGIHRRSDHTVLALCTSNVGSPRQACPGRRRHWQALPQNFLSTALGNQDGTRVLVPSWLAAQLLSSCRAVSSHLSPSFARSWAVCVIYSSFCV